jgi:hypothetical protein
MSFSINEDFSASEAPTSWSWRDKWGASPASENINSDDSASNDSIEQRNQITSTSGQSTTVADCYNTFWQEEKVKDNLQALESKLALRANMISSHD